MWDDDDLERLLSALTERSPLGSDQLLGVLDGRADVTATADDVADLLQDQAGVYELPDDRWVWLPTLLDGRVFTHRVGELELAHDLILIDVDLVTPLMLTELPEFEQLVDGSPIQDLHPAAHRDAIVERGVPVDDLDAEGVLLLAPGRLTETGVRVGDLVALRVTRHGFALSTVGDVPPSPVAPGIAALATADPQQPVDLFDAVLQLCADDDALLREPSAPLGEALGAAGLVHDGELVAVEGFDFAHARASDSLQRLQEQYDLDEAEAAAVAIVVGRCDDIAGILDDAVGEGGAARGDGWPLVSDAPGSPEEQEEERQAVAASIDLLAVPEVTDAVCWELDPSDARSSAALGIFAEAAERQAPRVVRGALRYLQAVAQERLGDIIDAEQTLGLAESLDPTWPPTLLRLAQYASDRGDAERALGLLQRAGVETDHPLVEVLQPYRSVARPDLGRNQPCWCGSGRKYKACHLHREEVALVDRATWLWGKAATTVPESAGALLVELAVIRAEGQADDDAVLKAMDDPLLADLLLVEGLQFYRFLAQRGALLPEDEHEMARQWLDVDRSVHEVVSASASTGAGVQLKDLRTGEVHEVSRWSAGRPLRVGERFCARVLPVGDSWQIPGSLEPISPAQSGDLLDLLGDEPGPVDVVRFLARGTSAG